MERKFIGFETQGRRHQKSKTGVSVAPQKGLISSKNFKKRRNSLNSWNLINHWIINWDEVKDSLLPVSYWLYADSFYVNSFYTRGYISK